jgi:hypothetical protein
VSRTAIFACRDARDPQWQLGDLPPLTGRFTLIGWKESTEAIEAGVPDKIAQVLARAFTSIARVIFLADAGGLDTWTPLKGDAIRTLTSKGFAARVASKLKGTPSDMALVSTRHPETAMRLFDDAGFPWWQQGQIVLLASEDRSHHDVEPEQLDTFDKETLLNLFSDDWTMRAAPLASKGVAGVVRPGVDGDVAGLLSLAGAFERTALDALERETRRAGFDWELVPEKALALR